MSYAVAIHWLFIVRASDNTQLHKKTNQGRGQRKERGGKKDKNEEGRNKKDKCDFIREQLHLPSQCT